ncbi:hypothetical protein F0U60_40845 [Archangium minus]|uniref:DUF4395 domain-containing protein n=1 Tax=Archangium minus TaxID=83450 RepID=A0ABY9X2X0_9BACT|nr:hypothetical protein F0U61_40555 [Archangium violaceum]WNG49762.1 hypothetical protein F0U60_40845 [Archangium minus]
MENRPEDFPGMPGATNTAAAREAVATPAILLMVTGGLGVVMALFGLLSSAMGGGELPPDLFEANPDLEQLRPWLERSRSFGAFGNVLTLALSGVTFFGGLKMKNLENFGLAMAASIIAILPCFGPCCCIGIPVGIWSLVVINKPEVKSAFR